LPTPTKTMYCRAPGQSFAPLANTLGAVPIPFVPCVLAKKGLDCARTLC